MAAQATNPEHSNSSSTNDFKSMKEMKDKNFGLSEEEFIQMQQAMSNGDESLFEQIYLSNFQKCVNILIKFNGANSDQAYSATMKALLEIRKELLQNKLVYDNLVGHFNKKARRELGKLKNKKSERMTIRTVDGMEFKDDKDFLKKIQSKEVVDCVGKAISRLEKIEKEKKPRCSNLLKYRYYYNWSYPAIAKKYYPGSIGEKLEHKASGIGHKVRGNCLPNFKIILEKILLKRLTKDFLDF